MDRYTECEQSYKRGYEAGLADGKGEWISVKERLPKKEEWVVVWNSVMGFDIDGIDKDGRWLLTNDLITHWMPLPEPPKGAGL